MAGPVTTGVHDEDIGVSPVGYATRHRAQQAPHHRVQSRIADDEQVRVDLLGQFHQRGNGGADDQPLLDVGGAVVPLAAVSERQAWREAWELIQKAGPRSAAGDQLSLLRVAA